MEAYAVVVFEESNGEDEVELIPTSWLMDKENKCAWPCFKTKWKVTKAIKEMWKPEESWSVHSIRLLAKCRKWSWIILLPCTAVVISFTVLDKHFNYTVYISYSA